MADAVLHDIPSLPIPGHAQCKRRVPTMTIDEQKALWSQFNSQKNLARFSGTKTRTCTNCGGFGHFFDTCFGPLDEDFCLYGCPIHGTWEHSFDQCFHPLAFTEESLQLHLMIRRTNRPPIFTQRFSNVVPKSNKYGPLSRRQIEDNIAKHHAWHLHDYSARIVDVKNSGGENGDEPRGDNKPPIKIQKSHSPVAELDIDRLISQQGQPPAVASQNIPNIQKRSRPFDDNTADTHQSRTKRFHASEPDPRNPASRNQNAYGRGDVHPQSISNSRMYPPTQQRDLNGLLSTLRTFPQSHTSNYGLVSDRASIRDSNGPRNQREVRYIDSSTQTEESSFSPISNSRHFDTGIGLRSFTGRNPTRSQVYDSFSERVPAPLRQPRDQYDQYDEYDQYDQHMAQNRPNLRYRGPPNTMAHRQDNHSTVQRQYSELHGDSSMSRRQSSGTGHYNEDVLRTSRSDQDLPGGRQNRYFGGNAVESLPPRAQASPSR